MTDEVIVDLANDFLKSDLSITAFSKQVDIPATTLRRRFDKLSIINPELFSNVRFKLDKKLCTKVYEADERRVLLIADLIIQTGLPLTHIVQVLEKKEYKTSYSSLKDLVHKKLPRYDLEKYKEVLNVIERSKPKAKEVEFNRNIIRSVANLIINSNYTLNEVVLIFKELHDIPDYVIYDYIFNILKKIDPKTYNMVILKLHDIGPIIKISTENNLKSNTAEIVETFCENPEDTSTRKTAKKFGISHVAIYDRLKSSSLLDKRVGRIVTSILEGNRPVKVISVKTENIIEQHIVARIMTIVALLKDGYTVTEIATSLDISYQIAYNDLTRKLPRLDPKLYEEVKMILRENKLKNLEKKKCCE